MITQSVSWYLRYPLSYQDLVEGDETTIDRIRREKEAAITYQAAEAIVLGCAGMTDLMSHLSEEFSFR